MSACRNLADLLLNVTSRDTPGLVRAKRGEVWEQISSRELRRRIARLAFQLETLGLRRGDCAAIIGENSPEWTITDFACIFQGVVVVPIYPTLTPAQTAFILNDCQAKAVFFSTPYQREKLETVRGDLPHLKTWVQFEGTPAAGVLSLAGLIPPEPLTAGEESRLSEMAARLAPEDLFSILYTSGTTGTPKGVMLTHHNMVSNVQASHHLVRPGELVLSFLPLSHVYERMVDYTSLEHGASIAYVANMEQVGQALIEVRPHVMAAVPRFFEKLYARVMEGLHQNSPRKQALFWWAVTTGKERLAMERAGKPLPASLRAKLWVADRLVFSKLKARMGGRLRIVGSGSAPLAPALIEFFSACGLTILEGYGLTETSPVLTANIPESNKAGTVGRPISGVELKIAEDGEILARGPNIMKGYYNRPEETAEALRDGWFHTGDIGHIDADGYLVITDRKKDLLKTAGGKYVAPQPIENKLRTNPYIQNVVVLGDRRKFVSALIVVNVSRLQSGCGITAGSPGELVHHPQAIAFMQRQVDEYTADLAQFERIKKIALLDQDFSIDAGTITPTLKVRRSKIAEQYAGLIDELYKE